MSAVGKKCQKTSAVKFSTHAVVQLVQTALFARARQFYQYSATRRRHVTCGRFNTHTSSVELFS